MRKLNGWRFLLLGFWVVSLHPQMLVDTVAGGKIRSGVPAQDVALSRLGGMAWDAAGNLVFCEPSANLIRRIRPDGIVETVAGNGATGFSGDGGPAVNAALHGPQNPHFDAKGNLYFADLNNYRIRRVDARGVITSIAGTGVWFASGMDLEGPALERSLDRTLIDLAVDAAGNVYLAESNSSVIRRVTTAGQIEIFAGVIDPNCYCSGGDGGPARLAHILQPGMLAADATGNLYVSEGGYAQHIRRIAPDGTITKFAGYGPPAGTTVDDNGQPALNVYWYGISGLTASPTGTVYVIQNPLPYHSPITTRIRAIDANGIITTVAGGAGGQNSLDGPALSAYISPTWLAADARGNVAFAEFSYPALANVLREVTSQSTLKTLAGGSPKPAPDGMLARDAWFLNPTAIAFNRAGELYVAETGTCLIRKIGATGLLTTAAGTGKCGTSAPVQPNTTQDLAPPAGIAVDSQNRLYVLDVSGNSYLIAQDGKIAPTGFLPTLDSGQIAIDAKDRVYLMGLFGLFRVSPDGARQTIVALPSIPGPQPYGSGPELMRALGVDPGGAVYFTGQYLGEFSNSIFRINDDGTFQRLYTGLFNDLSLAADASGNVWVANGRVSLVNAAGTATFGRQEDGYSGDGGLAQEARFTTSAVRRAANGDLYFLDGGRIRRVSGTEPKSAPAIASGGIVNAASFTGGAIAPGELVTIFGSNFESNFGGTGLRVNLPENNKIPWGIGSTKVLFDGFPGAITAMTPTQINVFVPVLSEPGKSVAVVVQVDGLLSAAVSVPVVDSAFGLSTVDQSGSGPGAILNQDGSVNSSANPASPSSVVSLFGTGEGHTSPQLIWGDLSISTPYSTPLQPVTVTIGGQPAEVQYAGAAPLLPTGVLQINARIPAGVNSGPVAVSVSVGSLATSKTVTVAVR